LCAGVPLDSSTVAITSTDPLMGTVVELSTMVIVEPVGAVNGTFSHATVKAQIASSTKRRNDRIDCTERPDKDNRLMGLAGQGSRGYAMAALLVGMSVMAVLMGALLPVWTHMATREKEAELVFRGNQYARAIGLFQRKYANTAPPSIDVLVEQRFLRKKYKDPITNDDFQPIYANQAMQGAISAPSGAQRPGQQATATLSTPAQQQMQGQFGSTGVGAQGGIIGVTSKSKENSIKILNGRDRYNEWAFVYIQTAQRPNQPGGVQAPGGAPGQQRPGQPGAFGMPGAMPGGGPGQRGFGAPPPPGSGFGAPQQFPPGFGQPNRPPFPQPGGNPNTIQGPGGTTFTPMVPGQRPPGQRPPGQ
jgi:type II secretory pathway pseudopilin PulG